MSPGQGLGDQLLPHIHTGGVFKGPVTVSAWLGLGPTLQGQAGVQLCLDVAAHPRFRPPADVHAVRVSCVQSRTLCSRPPLVSCPILPCLFPRWKFCLFFLQIIISNSTLGKKKALLTVVERNLSKISCLASRQQPVTCSRGKIKIENKNPALAKANSNKEASSDI